MGPNNIEVIPLIETPESMLAAKTILSDYARLCAQAGLPLQYLRPFVARSDPALNSGLVPAILGAKACLSGAYSFQESAGIPVYPIIGVGCLPFRGGLCPDSVRDFLTEYRGVWTPTIQSSFRYDYPLESVKNGVREVATCQPGKARIFDEDELALAASTIDLFSSGYRETVEGIAGDINRVAQLVPSRRERKLHIGLFGYSRQVNGKRLPRAIAFTAALYSLGVPPELIGTGRGLAQASAKQRDFLEENIVLLRQQLSSAGRFLNHENLFFLSKESPAWRKVYQDVVGIEEFLGEPLGPQTDEEYLHRNISANIRILASRNDARAVVEVERAAALRKSLG